MIECFIGLLLIADMSPSNPEEMYPSGIKEIDNYPYYNTISSQYAQIRTANKIKWLRPGIYEVGLSPKKDYMLLVQSGEILLVLPIVERTELEEEYSIPKAKIVDNLVILIDKKIRYKAKF